MKVWGIIATVLLVVFVGTSAWFYIENKDLKSQKSKVETDLSSAKDQYNKKVVAANKKIELLSMFFSGTSSNDQDSMLKSYNLINEINDATLTADWKAMQNTQAGDNSGTKMMQDLLSALSKDLK